MNAVRNWGLAGKVDSYATNDRHAHTMSHSAVAVQVMNADAHLPDGGAARGYQWKPSH